VAGKAKLSKFSHNYSAMTRLADLPASCRHVPGFLLWGISKFFDRFRKGVSVATTETIYVKVDVVDPKCCTCAVLKPALEA
jgi:hypothetical protein